MASKIFAIFLALPLLAACATSPEPIVVAAASPEPIVVAAEAESAPAVECNTSAEVIARIMNRFPEATVAAQWHDQQARSLIAGYNATPPTTYFEADRIVMIVHPRFRSVILIGFLDDCLQLMDSRYPINMVAQLDVWANDKGI